MVFYLSKKSIIFFAQVEKIMMMAVCPLGTGQFAEGESKNSAMRKQEREKNASVE